MVLEEDAQITSQDSYFAQDTDAGSSSADFSYDVTNLPRGFPFFRLSDELLKLIVDRRFKSLESIILRPLTPEERDAAALYSTRAHARATWGSPCGILVGAWRAYDTRRTFQFPMLSQKWRDRFIFDGQRLKLFGIENKRVVHSVRVGLYASVGSILGQILFASYGLTSSAMAEMQDPRMKDVTKLEKEYVERERKKRIDEMQRRNQDRNLPTDSFGQGDKSAGDLWGNHRQESGMGVDVGPTAGAEDYRFTSEEGPTTSETNIMSDSQARVQETHQQASRSSESHTMSNTSKGPSPEGTRTSQQPRDFASDYGLDTRSDTGSSSSQQDSGSVWDRIRRESASTPSANPSTSQRQRRRGSSVDEQTQGGEYAYSKREEDMSLAKGEAQRVFDERVEQERQGENFGSRRKW